MSVQKRKCASCKFFNESPLPGNGWCTHHKRQLSSDVRILVRKGELACRDPWGSDYWVSKADSAAAVEPEDIPRPATPDRLVAGPRADDQITSVTASLSAQTTGSDLPDAEKPVPSRGTRPDDVIVSQPSMLPEETPATMSERDIEHDRNDLNLPAHEDQQERVRIIARGNRDAIMKARERVMLRRSGSGPEHAGDTDDADPADGRSADSYGHGFPDDTTDPDPFPNGADQAAFRRVSRRLPEPRSRQVTPSRGYADPTPPVPPEEMGDRGRQSTIVSHRDDANRFESVPEVKPDVALPHLRRFLRTTESALEAKDGPVQDSHEQPETSYDRVLQRAQAIKTAAQKERNARVIRNRPISRPVAGFRPSSPQESTHISERVSPDSSTSSIPRHIHDGVDDGDREHNPSRDDVIMDDGPDHDGIVGAAQATEIEASPSDEFPGDELYAEVDSAYERAGNGSRTEPQESWWRGLNLGFLRRPHSDAATANGSYELNDWSDDESTAVSEWSRNEEEDEWEPSQTVERVFSFANVDNGDGVAEASTWLRDSRSAEDELIDYELTDEVLETSFADDNDRVQTESWHEDGYPEARDRGQGAASVDRAPRDSGFTLNNRHDMDAFRAVLFGGNTEDPTEPRRNRNQERRHHEPPAVPREELPAQRGAFTDTDAIPVAARQRYVEEPTFDIRNFVEQEDDLLDMRVQIAPDIPRACQTCRNFRPSESGERGWCTNDFAFTHRQMVNASDLPCQSSIGCWWLPDDDSWMPTEDLAAHENPTPLTDRLIARRHGQDPGDDRAYSELYVREI